MFQHSIGAWHPHWLVLYLLLLLLLLLLMPQAGLSEQPTPSSVCCLCQWAT
jgi:hypothetical protein